MRKAPYFFTWIFFVCLVYLILAKALAPWGHLPTVGNVGFTAVFVLFALLHCLVLEGVRRTLQFFVVSSVVSYAMEEVGVRTGLIFGAYHYGQGLGAELGHVPLIIPLAWFMMIYPSRIVAKELLQGIDLASVPGIVTLSIVAAWVMTAWDVVMDPEMALRGNWIWERGGTYFGVPAHNYFGWLLTTFLIYCISGWLWHGKRAAANATKVFAALPVFVYGLYSLRYGIANQVPELRLVAVFTMGLPALVATVRLCCIPTQSLDLSRTTTSKAHL